MQLLLSDHPGGIGDFLLCPCSLQAPHRPNGPISTRANQNTLMSIVVRHIYECRMVISDWLVCCWLTVAESTWPTRPEPPSGRGSLHGTTSGGTVISQTKETQLHFWGSGPYFSKVIILLLIPGFSTVLSLVHNQYYLSSSNREKFLFKHH